MHAKILDYVQQKNIDLENLNEDELLRILNELQLLDGIESRFKNEDVSNEPTKEMNHSLSITITKGRKFKQLCNMEKPSSFYFVLSGFSQKVRSASYPAA